MTIDFYNIHPLTKVSISKSKLELILTSVPPRISRNVIIKFIGEVSILLLRKKSLRTQGDIIAFASFFRRKALSKLVDQNLSIKSNLLFIPRGKAFIICPSNVELILFYNLFISLLCGNHTILKISKYSGETSEIVLTAISEVINKHAEFLKIKELITIVQYNNETEITSQISTACNVRLIWGGDETINIVRKSTLNPLAQDYSFADRFSISLIDADLFLSLEKGEQIKIVKQFYLDISQFSQQGCSSPRMIFWLNGNERNLANTKFCKLLDNLMSQVSFDIDQTERFVSSSLIASSQKVQKISQSDYVNNFQLFDAKDLEHIRKYHSGNNLIYHVNCNSIEDMISLIDAKDQTLSVFVEDFNTFALSVRSKTHYVDRIVKLGQALDFDYLWDGLNLFNCLSKQVRY